MRSFKVVKITTNCILRSKYHVVWKGRSTLCTVLRFSDYSLTFESSEEESTSKKRLEFNHIEQLYNFRFLLSISILWGFEMSIKYIRITLIIYFNCRRHQKKELPVNVEEHFSFIRPTAFSRFFPLSHYKSSASNLSFQSAQL